MYRLTQTKAGASKDQSFSPPAPHPSALKSSAHRGGCPPLRVHSAPERLPHFRAEDLLVVAAQLVQRAHLQVVQVVLVVAVVVVQEANIERTLLVSPPMLNRGGVSRRCLHVSEALAVTTKLVLRVAQHRRALFLARQLP